jgi:hypothetical protein
MANSNFFVKNGLTVGSFEVTASNGNVTAGTVNKVTLTAPATGSTLTIADGKTLTANNTLTFTGTDASSVAFGAGGTVMYSGGALGTPSSITLTNGTGLPISTGVSGLGTNVAAFLATPSSANLAAAITDESGASGTVVFSGSKLNVFASTSSSELAGIISDDTGTGALVFGTSPAITTSLTTGSTSFALLNTTATTVSAFGAATTLNMGAGTGTTTIANDLVVSGNLTINGTTTTINATTVSTDDINITLGDSASPTDVTAAGGGITLKGTTDKSITWGATNGWTSTETVNIASGKTFKINGTDVLSGTTLGSGVTGSSLTSVGTIGTGTWNGTLIGSSYGGTGVNNGSATLTMAASVTHAGAFAQTFTATGITSLTLPTSGTLATTSNKLSAFAATSSSELAGVMSDETGSGALVFATSPTLVTPVLGAATATTVNKVTLTAPATGSTLTIADGKTLTASNTLTFTGTDASSVAFGSGGTVLYSGGSLGTPLGGVATNLTGTASGLTAGNVTTNANLTGHITSVGNAAVLGSFTSAQLLAALTDETGTGSAVFATSPTLITPALGTPSALVGTNITGTASGLTAGNVTTNANLTGHITSVGNAAVLGSFTSAQLLAALTDETGTGSAVFGTSPTFTTQITTPVIVKSGTTGVGDIGQTGNTYATVYATTFSGVSTTAKYADLAEKYSADADYEPGTVLHFGGDAEVTVCDTDMCSRVAGVVTTSPAHLMNSALEGVTAAIALQGRVPCKVVGPVSKGDMMVSAGNGAARAEANPKMGSVIGKSLENFTGETGVIEVAVGRL